jgi:peptidoglycan/LPS O-acetylase OafA/YrhL
LGRQRAQAKDRAANMNRAADERLGDRPGAATAVYRPDIDGLRAIAVVAVVAFHAFDGVLPGGFVGVDIFFVISGYLITGILISAIDQRRLSFAGFYARRIRRLFPALAIVLAVSFLAGWWLLLPDEFGQLGRQIAAGAGFVANVSLFRQSGYFDEAAALKPLLHLWSLGVEEQFYLVWPLLLLIAWRLRIGLLTAILAVFLASFAWNVVRVHTHESATFYLLDSRFWELAMGGALVCWELRRPTAPSAPAIARHLVSCAGLAILLATLIGYDSEMLFPGWWALGPTLGSLMLIAAGPQAAVNRHLLGRRPMVFLGLLSYPLYVWHWPLLSLDRIVDPAPSRLTRVALVLLAFGLAWLTFQFVERPTRSLAPRLRAVLALALPVAVLGALGFLSYHGKIKPYSARFGLDKIMQAAHSPIFPGPHLRPLDKSDSPLLEQGVNSATVLFVGDSFIEQYYPRMDWLLETRAPVFASVVFASSGGCPPIPEIEEAHHAACKGLLGRAERFAQRPNVSTVVIGANWLGYFVQPDPRFRYYIGGSRAEQSLLLGSPGADLALARLEDMIARFRRMGKEVYLLLQSPNDAALDPRRFIRSRWGSHAFEVRPSVESRAAIVAPMQPLDARLRAIGEAAGAHIIDPVDYLCGVRCPTMTADGWPVYRDEGHLNPEYVRNNVRFLDSIVTLPSRGATAGSAR